MLPCDKRQTIVKRSEGLTILRCTNKKSGMNGQKVDEGVCSRCPVRAAKRGKPCDKAFRGWAQPTPSDTGGANNVNTNHFTEEELNDIRDIEGVEAGSNLVHVPPGPSDQHYPSYIMLVWAYKEALVKWNKAGRPVRTQKEVADLHKICEDCDWYDKTQKRCKGCGCLVTLGGTAVFNKLKMATEHCPQELF